MIHGMTSHRQLQVAFGVLGGLLVDEDYLIYLRPIWPHLGVDIDVTHDRVRQIQGWSPPASKRLDSFNPTVKSVHISITAMH